MDTKKNEQIGQVDFNEANENTSSDTSSTVTTKKVNIAKKWWFWVIIAAAVILIFATLGGGSGSSNQGTGDATPGMNSSQLGDYSVVISDCRLAEDYEGKPVVIVKYRFTNNSDEATAFWTALDANVYQNDIGLNECIFVDDSANYSSDNQMKEIKKGATLDVEVAYELNDQTTPIDVEVQELFSFSDKKITKSFNIK